jgi:hypothetical protein
MEDKNFISRIVGDISFTIKDFDENFILIDIPKKLYNDPEKSVYKGAIFDIKNEKPLVLSEKHYEEKVITRPLIPVKNTKIYKGYDGTVIRVFRHEGKTYYSTLRKLDASKNFLLNTKKSIKEYYDEFGGLKEQEIFEKEGYEEYVHLFLLVMQENQLFSQEIINNGSVFYIGSMKKGTSNVEILPCEKFKRPQEIGIKEANKILGFHRQKTQKIQDDRLDGSGFVILYNQEQKTKVHCISKAYAWRKQILGEKNPNNIFFVYCLLTNDISLNEEEFKKKYPFVEINDGTINLKSYEKVTIINEIKRKCILNSLFLAAPIHRKKEALESEVLLENCMNFLCETLRDPNKVKEIKKEIIEKRSYPKWIIYKIDSVVRSRDVKSGLWNMDGASFYYVHKAVKEIMEKKTETISC